MNGERRELSHLRTRTLEPEDLREVVSVRVLERVFKHLHLLDQRQVVVVRRHLVREQTTVSQQVPPGERTGNRQPTGATW